MKPSFEIGKALGFAIEVARARPSSFITLAVWTILYGAVLGVFQVQAIGDDMAVYMTSLTSAPAPGNDDTAETLQAISQYFSATLPFTVVALILGIVVESAWLRLFVRGQDGGVFPFRVGRDEGVYAITGLLILLIFIAALLLSFIAMFVIASLFASLGTAGAAIGGLLGGLIMFGLLVVVITQVSPALALSLLKNHISMGAAIRGAQKIFWPLLGSFIVSLVVMMLFYSVITGLISFMPFNEFGRAPSGDFVGWQAMFPYYVIVQLIALIPVAIMRGVACYAALQIDEGNRPLADTFS